MRLISNKSELSANLVRLIKGYDNISLAVAWASAETEPFDALIERKACINKAVIGTHFYQTDPKVLSSFVGNNSVRFKLQTSGVFHPKIYLFWQASKWEAIVGSANFTKGAIGKNSEACLLISYKDGGAEGIKDELENLIRAYWRESRTVTAAITANYKRLWDIRRNDRARLSGITENDSIDFSPLDSDLYTRSWGEFYRLMQNDQHGFEVRHTLLAEFRNLFRNHAHFLDMNEDERKAIGGLPSTLTENWGWFGSMIGAGIYHEAVRRNNHHISRALDAIPQEGPVTVDHYNSYVAEFLLAFPEGGGGMATASRLLAMKRPDYFICLDGPNREALCADLRIPQNINFERYWTRIVEPVTGSLWWNSPRPTDPLEAQVWEGRVAMLDAVYYGGSD